MMNMEFEIGETYEIMASKDTGHMTEITVIRGNHVVFIPSHGQKDGSRAGR